ncbi:MAG: hypothetical protein ACFE95_01850 [Candidatus Hodarchaeota archaeon]
MTKVSRSNRQMRYFIAKTIAYLVEDNLLKKTSFLHFFLLIHILIGFVNMLEVQAGIHDDSTLFISEDTIDNSLIMALKNELNSSGDVTDIKTSGNLNDLFLEHKYLERYSTIIMAASQVSSPFNETLVNHFEEFIINGGTCVIVSPQIWRFPESFHNLLELSINSTGQKEWPPGNASEAIDLIITNDSLTQKPYLFQKDSVLHIQGKMGIAAPTDVFFSIAESQTTLEGKTTINAFHRESGFVIAAPISPSGTNTSIITFSQFLTSILTSKTMKEASNLMNSPLNPLLRISDDNIQFVIISTAILLLFSGLVYLVYYFRNNKIVFSETKLPRDHDWLSKFLLGPIVFLGHVIYPPMLRRINREAVVENETRQNILESLKNRDFLHFRELKRELGIGTSSLKWHLRVLEDFNIIHHQRFGQYEIFFLLANAPNPKFVEIYFAVISGIGFRVANAFLQMNSWNLDRLTEYLGDSREAIRYHVKKLEKMNLLVLIGENKYILNAKKRKYLVEAINRRKQTN